MTYPTASSESVSVCNDMSSSPQLKARPGENINNTNANNNTNNDATLHLTDLQGEINENDIIADMGLPISSDASQQQQQQDRANSSSINNNNTPNDSIFPASTDEFYSDRVVNFPNGNSSSAFPDLSPSINTPSPSSLPIPQDSSNNIMIDNNSDQEEEETPEEMETDFDFGELQAVDSMGNMTHSEAIPPGSTLLDAVEDNLANPNSTHQSVDSRTMNGNSNVNNDNNNGGVSGNGVAGNNGNTLPKAAKTQERRNRAEEINVDTSAGISVRMVPKFHYKYHQTEDFPDELREWFLFENNNLLYELRTQYVCSYRSDWRMMSTATKKQTLETWIENLGSDTELVRNCALSYIAYVALGSYETVTSTQDHINQIKINTKFLWRHGILPHLYKIIIKAVNSKVPKNLYDTEFDDYYFDMSREEKKAKEEALDNQLFIALTAMYFIVESNRDDLEFVKSLNQLEENILLFIIESISRLRWVIEGNLPLRPMLLLFWKCMLCLFGNDTTFKEMKSYMLKKFGLPEKADENLVMASPLDYHAFRQDIVSRYPSYVPPTSILPENFDNSRSMTHFIEVPRPIIAQTSNSTLPVPTVHIATPAPSPPASPAIAAGQKVRKSVFMTNQSFPFIHPTDENIPKSIIEASELFHSRLKTTPGMVQLWEEREKFMQQERGWIPVPKEKADFEESQKEEAILERIEKLYIASLPHLNSFVLVLLKFLLANISFTTPESNIDTYLSASNAAGYDSRAKDIGLKAVSSVILGLYEWFEVSHICKAEYLASLLFDSRYYLIVFKYFYLHNPVEKALQILDSSKEDFFKNCKEFSTRWNEQEEAEYQEKVLLQKEEEKKQRILDDSETDEIRNADEITFSEKFPDFSNRYFLTTINLLRVLRKIIQKKTQRVIVVAELPPETLKKTLSIFQPDIWTNVLEIFKEQVPYNGRKWRSTNMDLVSAIYLHCKTKLRDDWLVNGDPNAEVEDAQPQEVAIRALIQFYNERLKREVLRIHTSKQGKNVKNQGENIEPENSMAVQYQVENLNTETFETVDPQDLSDDDDDEEPPDFFSLELDAIALGHMSM